jgi:hypothetical protein
VIISSIANHLLNYKVSFHQYLVRSAAGLFIDYFNRNVATDPSLFDASIVGCAHRMDFSDQDPICRLFPALCE